MNSDNNNNGTPRLRFPGFTGEWEEKKLGEMANKINRRNHHLEVSRVLTNSANAGVVDQSDYFDRDIAVKENTANYHIVELEDFVYNPRISTAAPVGPISINKVGRGIMSPLYTVFRFHTGCIPFYEQYFQTTIWHPYLKSIANFGARFDRMNITSEGFFNMPLHLPSHAEQKKIAECLSAVDELIAAQEQKVGNLKERKRGLMQQLFPQSGETTPRLRFPGFTGEWVKKKLANVATSFSGGTPKSSEPRYYGGTIPFIRSGEIHSTETALFITEEGLNNSSAKLVNKGDLLYALYGATSGDVAISKINGAINQAILCIRSKEINSCFLCNYLERIKETITSRYLQGGQGNLSSDIIMSLTIPLPSLAEQEKIAMCLSEMETLITAESVRMEALKSHKRGLVQQLFPQSIK